MVGEAFIIDFACISLFKVRGQWARKDSVVIEAVEKPELAIKLRPHDTFDSDSSF